jgi:hypothetical protein
MTWRLHLVNASPSIRRGPRRPPRLPSGPRSGGRLLADYGRRRRVDAGMTEKLPAVAPEKNRPFLICRRIEAARAKLLAIVLGSERRRPGNSRLRQPPVISKRQCCVNMLGVSSNQLALNEQVRACVSVRMRGFAII